MRISYTNNYWHLLLFNALHQLRSPAIQVLCVSIAAACVYMAFNNTAERGCTACALVVVTIAFLGYYFVLMSAQLAFTAIYLYSRRNVTMLTKHSLELREDGLYVETAYCKSLFLWPGIFKISKMAGMVVVYTSPYSAHIIPSSAFPTSVEKNSFVQLLRDRPRTI